jgi:superfamily II DNA helicase RecQ
MHMERAGGDDSLVEMFHAHLDSESEVAIPNEFKVADGNVRCLISTIAFGMGMQVPNVNYVLHWRPPKSVVDYLQEIDRCARNGGEGEAIMYFPPNTMRKDRIDSDMLQVIKSANVSCIKLAALRALQLRSCSDAELVKCCHGPRCCSYCTTNN